MNVPASETCTWCGRAVQPDDGYRAGEQPGARTAVFCRLEHVVPWSIQGARWEAGEITVPEQEPEGCSGCGERLGDVRVLLVRHRGEHRIADAFCSVEHMATWAKSGGRWRGAQPDR